MIGRYGVALAELEEREKGRNDVNAVCLSMTLSKKSFTDFNNFFVCLGFLRAL